VTDFHDLYEEDESPSREQPDLDTTLKALAANKDGSANTTIFYGLANLDANDIAQVRPVWDRVLPEYRARLLKQLVDISEANFELDYRELGIMALNDSDPAVRENAIELLWEDESLTFMDRLIDMAQWDESNAVRAAAAGALGHFILLGELGDLPETETIRAQDAVISLLTNDEENSEVRRRALEAIANCSHEIVNEAIDEAYNSDDAQMQASAVFAMGRSCDMRWNETVMQAFESDDPEIRFEATRASGELTIEEAIPILARFAQEDDREIKEMAIWSLGEIGGNFPMRVLGSLAEEAEDANDLELLEVIEEAIGNASLAGQDMDLDDLDDLD
jgi:HEAT repeat protein